MIARFTILFLVLFLFSGNVNAEIPYEIPQKAVNFINQGKFDKAREELNNFRKKNPENPLGLFYLACIELDTDKALALFKEVETLSEPSLASEALYRRAELYYSLGRFDLATELYNELTKKYPDSDFRADTFCRLGSIALEAGLSGDAISFFNKSMENDKSGKKRLLALAGIMESYVKSENWNRAMETAIAVLKENDDLGAMTPRVLEVLSLSWQKIGNQANSDRFTERLINNYPGSYQAHSVRAEGYSADKGDSTESASAGNKGRQSSDEDSFENSKTEFTVQAAAFKERNNALKLMRSLKNAGFDSRIDMKSAGGENLFVVRVGYYKTKEEAQKAVDRISKIAGTKASVMLLNQ